MASYAPSGSELHARSPPGVPMSSSNVEFSSYPFLELRSLSCLDKWDISYLGSKGCFTIPVRRILDEFVKKYFLHIHVGTPILDEAEFWQLYCQQGNRASSHGRNLSVLVLQAMLFRSCPVRRFCLLSSRGKLTLLLLLDLKAEDQPLERAQGALLLSYQASPDDPQIGSLLLANAIQNAIILGKPPKPSDSVKKSTIKRLWWSILLRDRWISLALRRRSQLTTKDFDAENNTLEEGDFTEEIQESKVYDVQTKRILFKVLQQQCRLAVVLTDMNSFIFSSWESSGMGLPSKEFPTCMGNVLKTRNRLRQWDTESRYSLSSTLSNVLHSVTSFIKMTYVYYYTAHIHLAHYEALLLEANLMFVGHSYTMQLQQTGDCLQEAVNELHDVLKYFSNMKDIEVIPLSILAFIGWPIVVAAIDAGLARNNSEAVQRQQRLNVLGTIYHALIELYDVTKFVVVGTKEILRLVTKMSGELGSQGRRPARASEAYRQRATYPTRTWKAVEAKHASGWFDLFIRYPRIYLLISTSTDYSLSSGRLPHENGLPEVLRSVASGFLGFQLPWVTKVSLDETERKAQESSVRPRDITEVDFIGPSAQLGPRTTSQTGPQMYTRQQAPEYLFSPCQVTQNGQGLPGDRDEPAVAFEFPQSMPPIDAAFCLPRMDDMVYPVPWKGPLNASGMSFAAGTESMDTQEQAGFRDSHGVLSGWKI
ncbi:hypothetical protein BDV37DRAFT_291834 [Aspergillus pseudonomiae]|uniref:Xylanolytic transcriptional activator regulatory domain-containing protein n=1 Tax=Aspergillus pseudonomiae TaxID=1506151 RepID=A0A5N7DKQ6_9EURO|nr:uncharacterized protein BDV37DRAFT_291834 [Aspergillus pseudonomiae]KAE8406689.1 hypothetical protein BDV37DRAFT_291834 [Aspergillus pseudonomiae]